MIVHVYGQPKQIMFYEFNDRKQQRISEACVVGVNSHEITKNKFWGNKRRASKYIRIKNCSMCAGTL